MGLLANHEPNFSHVLPTSHVGYHTSKPIESVVYCLIVTLTYLTQEARHIWMVKISAFLQLSSVHLFLHMCVCTTRIRTQKSVDWPLIQV